MVSDLKVLKHNDAEALLRAAEKKLSKNIVKNNGTEQAKAVSGASMSSAGIIAAVNDALKKTK